jgi:hypothetical protein
MASKVCSICCVDKPIEQYYLAHNDGSQTRRKDCKQCFKDRRKPNVRPERKEFRERSEMDAIVSTLKDVVKGYDSVVRTQDIIIQAMIHHGLLGNDSE